MEAIVQHLLDGDEAAFTALVEQYHPAFMRLARSFVASQEIAEEVVQDAWLGILKGLPSFQGRSSLKSWMFAIVVHKAKTRGTREARSTPFSALARIESGQTEYAVAPERFLGADTQWPGHWRQPPSPWGDNPEVRLLQADAMAELSRIIDGLPAAQRAVVTMRDLAGMDPEAICNELEISETNMRVLLHRGRSRIRSALETYLT